MELDLYSLMDKAYTGNHSVSDSITLVCGKLDIYASARTDHFNCVQMFLGHEVL